MSKTKIAIIHDCLHVGGTEKALLTMLKFFDYQKYDVTLWLMDGSGELQAELDERVMVRYYSNEGYPGKELIKEYVRSRSYKRLIESMLNRVKSKKAINNHYENLKYSIFSLPLINDEEYDCVIVYQGLYMQLLATALGRLNARKRVLWIHMRFNHDREQIESFRSVYQRFDKIYCVSNDLRDHFVNVYGMQDKTEVMHNCFDVNGIRKKAREAIDIDYGQKSILTTVGRVSKEKGQLMIPEIASRLKNVGYDFVWLIIGKGNTEEELALKINEFHLDDTVLLLGNKLNPYPYIKKCTVYVQPSYSEGYCTSTMEAKILGKPVVTTNVSGMNEQFTDGVDGMIADSANPDSVFNKLLEVCKSKEMQKSLSQNAILKIVDNRYELTKLDRFIERGKE